MLNFKLYYCSKCDNLIEVTNQKNHDVKLNKEELQELIPNTVEAAKEKHIPAVTIKDNILKVCVGSVEHPMTEEHSIRAIYVVTEDTVYRKYLTAEEKPVFEIPFEEGKHAEVYAYCNLHGLWKKSI